MSVVLESDPRLPVELEREIFILATSDIHICDIRSILLVARRVQLCISYLTVLQGHPDSIPLLSCVSQQCSVVDDDLPLRRTPKEFRQMVLSSPATVTAHIRDLWIPVYIWVDPTQLGKFLSACSTIETLGIFGNSFLVPGILPALARLPLRRLSLHLLSLFGGVPGQDDFKVDFTHPMFARLTHLSLQDRPAPYDWPSQWSGLFGMPCLTHLSFEDFFAPYVIADVLAKCRTLRLLVLKTSNASRAHEDLTPDVRCVVVFVENSLQDWEAGVSGGTDYWSKAEVICNQRQMSVL
ncbi:hypothetical protein C8R46DRAFT_1286285 [Mycena filopes]|nr:hypothetical protein C8R46DRAFT_1286285 [Mycena filopes]